MEQRITLRLSEEFYQRLKIEAHQKEISISDVARNHIGNSLLKENIETNHLKKTHDDFCPHPEKPLRESHPLLIETVFLLRQLCLRADS